MLKHFRDLKSKSWWKKKLWGCNQLGAFRQFFRHYKNQLSWRNNMASSPASVDPLSPTFPCIAIACNTLIQFKQVEKAIITLQSCMFMCLCVNFSGTHEYWEWWGERKKELRTLFFTPPAKQGLVLERLCFFLVAVYITCVWLRRRWDAAKDVRAVNGRLKTKKGTAPERWVRSPGSQTKVM